MLAVEGIDCEARTVPALAAVASEAGTRAGAGVAACVEPEGATVEPCSVREGGNAPGPDF